MTQQRLDTSQARMQIASGNCILQSIAQVVIDKN
jgi:hypothetical protein